MLVIKASIDDADDDAGAVIIHRQTITVTVNHLAGVSHAQGAVGAHFQHTTPLHLQHARQTRNLLKARDGNLSGNKAVKLRSDNRAMTGQQRYRARGLDVDKGIDPLYPASYKRWRILLGISESECRHYEISKK